MQIIKTFRKVLKRMVNTLYFYSCLIFIIFQKLRIFLKRKLFTKYFRTYALASLIDDISQSKWKWENFRNYIYIYLHEFISIQTIWHLNCNEWKFRCLFKY